MTHNPDVVPVTGTGAVMDIMPIQSEGSANQSPRKVMETCKHLRVQIVAREEDSEFVECKECGEVFESSEFKDMSIEEKAAPAEE